MGMYSTFIEQCIKVTDAEGLDKLQKAAELNGDNSFDYLIEADEVKFSIWDGQKVYGYNWKDQVLKDLAKYIEGWVTFYYEAGFKFKITFLDGKAYMAQEKRTVYGKDEEVK